jgi:hypothetical protein
MDLTTQQAQAVADGQPVPVVINGVRCIVLREDLYDRVKRAIDYDDSDWTDEEMRSVMGRTMADDWSDPRMDIYDETP